MDVVEKSIRENSCDRCGRYWLGKYAKNPQDYCNDCKKIIDELENPCMRCEIAEATYNDGENAYCMDCLGYLEARAESMTEE